MKLDILIVVGTRPHFIKAAPLIHALDHIDWSNYTLVHTGQHYDPKMSKCFFEELDLPSPHHNLEIKLLGQANQIAQMLKELDVLIRIHKPQLVIVFGDTNSSAAGAMAASMNNVKLAHIEAGMREFDKTIPEEKNKLIISTLADFHFVPTTTGIQNLQAMGIKEDVYLVGDIVLDLLLNNEQKYSDDTIINKMGLKAIQYYFATCHRPLITDNSSNLKEILIALSNLAYPVVWPIHPRTEQAIDNFKLNHLVGKNILIKPPLSFWETQILIKNSAAVITDSGGVIREAYFHKVPGVIIDNQTEWMETVTEGWNYITGPNKQRIEKTLMQIKKPTEHSNALGDGQATMRILSVLKKISSYDSTHSHTGTTYR